MSRITAKACMVRMKRLSFASLAFFARHSLMCCSIASQMSSLLAKGWTRITSATAAKAKRENPDTTPPRKLAKKATLSLHLQVGPELHFRDSAVCFARAIAPIPSKLHVTLGRESTHKSLRDGTETRFFAG